MYSVAPLQSDETFVSLWKNTPKDPTASAGDKNKEEKKMRRSKKVMVLTQQNRNFMWKIIVIISGICHIEKFQKSLDVSFMNIKSQQQYFLKLPDHQNYMGHMQKIQIIRLPSLETIIQEVSLEGGNLYF